MYLVQLILKWDKISKLFFEKKIIRETEISYICTQLRTYDSYVYFLPSVTLYFGIVRWFIYSLTMLHSMRSIQNPRGVKSFHAIWYALLSAFHDPHNGQVSNIFKKWTCYNWMSKSRNCGDFSVLWKLETNWKAISYQHIWFLIHFKCIFHI